MPMVPPDEKLMAYRALDDFLATQKPPIGPIRLGKNRLPIERTEQEKMDGAVKIEDHMKTNLCNWRRRVNNIPLK